MPADFMFKTNKPTTTPKFNFEKKPNFQAVFTKKKEECTVVDVSENTAAQETSVQEEVTPNDVHETVQDAAVENEPVPAEAAETEEQKTAEPEAAESIVDEPEQTVEAIEETPVKEVAKKRTKKEKAKKEEPEEAEEESKDAAESEETDDQEEADTKKKKRKVHRTVKPAAIKDYEEAISVFANPISTPKWDSLVETINNELSNITIKADIDPAVLGVAAEQIDRASNTILQAYNEYQALLMSLIDKDCGLVAYVKAVNSVGSNDAERKQHANEACTVYKNEIGETINLLELVRSTRIRVGFLKGAYDRLQCKRNMLYTLTTELKMSK